MAQVDVTINGRSYRVACEDGQEQRLTELAQYVDAKVGELARSVGQIGDTRLLVMASLLVADELSDARDALVELQGQGNGATIDKLASGLDSLAQRIEKIAARLEAS
ncbi:MAG: cell division protein ZapA [Alphaproteobacteria bacterium]|nr:cell division protein ZapA [Alphaproteobacteria bacterium]